MLANTSKKEKTVLIAAAVLARSEALVNTLSLGMPTDAGHAGDRA